jgi:hypothetical protein
MPVLRQHVRENRRPVGLGQADGKPGLADAGLVLSCQSNGFAQLRRRGSGLGAQQAAAALHCIAIAQHDLGSIVGVQNGTAAIRQNHAAP